MDIGKHHVQNFWFRGTLLLPTWQGKVQLRPPDAEKFEVLSKDVIPVSIDTAMAAELRADTQRDASRDLAVLISRLPAEARECFIQELLEAALEQQATGDGNRLQRALLSLEISPAIHGIPGYTEAVSAAEGDDRTETVDFAEYVTGLRGRRSHPA